MKEGIPFNVAFEAGKLWFQSEWKINVSGNIDLGHQEYSAARNVHFFV